MAEEAPRRGLPLDIFTDLLVSRGARSLANQGMRRTFLHREIEAQLLDMFSLMGLAKPEQAEGLEGWAKLEALHLLRRYEFGLAPGTKVLVERIKHFFPTRARKALAVVESLLVGLVEENVVALEGGRAMFPVVPRVEFPSGRR